MNLSQQDREKIYFEEKKLRETHVCASKLLLMIAAGTVIGFAGMLFLKNKKKTVTLENLRMAYSGLSPDEEDE